MNRLYVIVRGDLPPPYKAVQAGHAVAEWMKNYDCWANGTLIYLEVKNLEELNYYKDVLCREKVKWVEFIEPDIGNEITALATAERKAKQLFKGLPLL